MAKVLTLVNGIPRLVDESATPVIYDEVLEVVASGASGDNEINGPISAGVLVALPDSRTYVGDELEVYLDGDRLKPIFDYNYSSSTQVAFTFELKVGDIIRFRIDRGA